MRFAIAVLCCCACGGPPVSPLERAFENAAQIPHLASLRVVQDGKILEEKYWSGDASTPHDVRSVTKSVTSLLVGIAAQQGCLPLDATLGETLGSRAPSDPAKQAITVRELLEMSGGFRWDELGNTPQYNDWVSSSDPVAFVLDEPLDHAPGTYFSYDSAGFFLLAVALTDECGDVQQFAQTHLFGPLGIAAPDWESFASPAVVNGSAGIRLSTEDLTKLGKLLLANDGSVVPASYLTAATQPQINSGDATLFGPGYGYGFWVGDGFFMAQGYGGQFIVVAPAKRAVVVATSDWQGHSATAEATFEAVFGLISRGILPLL